MRDGGACLFEQLKLRGVPDNDRVAGSVHAFYCMLGISLLQYVRRQTEPAWPGLSTEELLDQLRQIQTESGQISGHMCRTN